MSEKPNYQREVFIRRLSEFLYRVCTDGNLIDAEEFLRANLPKELMPLRDFKFKPIYTFEKVDKKGTDNYSHNPLYEYNGCLIGMFFPDIKNNFSKAKYGYELWLLDNMQIVAVSVCKIDICSESERGYVIYRYRTKNSIYNFADTKFSYYDFMDEIVKFSQVALDGYIDYCSYNGKCETCPLIDGCEFADESEEK